MSEATIPFAPRYSNVAIALHWLTALLIVAAFVVGFTMTDMRLSPAKLRYFSWHKWIGVTVFILALLRVLWLRRFAAPALPATMPAWQQRLAHATHALLYTLMFVDPLSGWLYSSAAGVPVVYLGLVPLPDLVPADKALAAVLKSVHHALDWTLLVVILAHVGAALKHHFFDRDHLLRRMWPARNPVHSRLT